MGSKQLISVQHIIAVSLPTVAYSTPICFNRSLVTVLCIANGQFWDLGLLHLLKCSAYTHRSLYVGRELVITNCMHRRLVLCRSK
jgi:hypothetical protein